MSVLVDPANLEAVTASYGNTAYAVVAGSSGPRITHVTPEFDAAAIAIQLGAGSGEAAKRAGGVTLLWPAVTGEPMSLIVDCVVETVTEHDRSVRVALRAEHAVRHRAAPG